MVQATTALMPAYAESIKTVVATGGHLLFLMLSRWVTMALPIRPVTRIKNFVRQWTHRIDGFNGKWVACNTVIYWERAKLASIQSNHVSIASGNDLFLLVVQELLRIFP